LNILDRWKQDVANRKECDRRFEQEHGIQSDAKDWVTSAEIDRLRIRMAPWLRKRHLRR
jgi:hypothetical protein